MPLSEYRFYTGRNWSLKPDQHTARTNSDAPHSPNTVYCIHWGLSMQYYVWSMRGQVVWELFHHCNEHVLLHIATCLVLDAPCWSGLHVSLFFYIRQTATATTTTAAAAHARARARVCVRVRSNFPTNYLSVCSTHMAASPMIPPF